MSAPVPVPWEPRAEPLAPLALAARGAAALALAHRLLGEDDARLAGWTGVAGDGLLLVLGAGDGLPWIDGGHYLGRDPQAPSLLLPLHRRPAVPLPLFERALLARGDAPLPLAVLADPSPCWASAAAARPLSRRALAGWLARQEAAGPPAGA